MRRILPHGIMLIEGKGYVTYRGREVFRGGML
jgi:hypothetical protein